MVTSFEEKQGTILETEAFTALKTEYPKYFEAISKHPRSLVGTEVPSTTHDGMEKLRDSADAADWQAAAKQLLAEEAASRVETRRDEMREVFSTVHSSIALFQNNADLIPGTKQFDRELADEFAKAVGDYALRTDGKLIGYSVPVQPIVNAIRSSLVRTRATATPAAAPSPQQQRAAEQPRTPAGQWDGPQAGLRSQAGSSAPEGGDEAQGVLSAFLRQNGMQI